MPRFYLRGVSYVCENKGILYFVYIYFEVDMQNKSKEFSFTVTISSLSGFLPFIVLVINQRLINELQLMENH